MRPLETRRGGGCKGGLDDPKLSSVNDLAPRLKGRGSDMKHDTATCGSMASPYGSRAVGLTRSAVLPTVALLACVFLWPALLTFHVGDWPSPNQHPHNNPAANACGLVGAWCAYHLRHFLGDGTYLLLLFATLAALLKVVRGEIGSIWERVFGLGLVVACTSASAHLICDPGPRSMPVGHGGLVGYALGDLLTGNLSRVGTIIVLTSSWVVGLIFATQGWILKNTSIMGRAAQA